MEDSQRKLTAKVSPELHRRVRVFAMDRKITIDRLIETALEAHFRSELSGKGEYTGSASQHLNKPEVDLPEQFLRNCADIYLASADEWTALSRVVAAVSRGQESLRAGSADRPRPTPVIRPLPVEQSEKDDKAG